MSQEVFFTNIQKKIIENLRECSSDVKIAVAWFTDKIIIKEINELIKNNVNVQIIIYDDHINQKEFFEELYYRKAQIFLSKKLMHNKFCIIDNKTVINGSYNWTNNASTNEENIQITHNDSLFAEKFVNQFNKLASNCKTIDTHFDYSLSNLQTLQSDFDKFYLNWPNYTYPYFINTSGLKASVENWSTKIFGHVYFIKNQIDEKSFLWIYYVLNTKYSIIKLQNIKGQKLELPKKFGLIHQCQFDNNGVSEFKLKNYIIEEHNINKFQSASTRYYLYSIDKFGERNSELFRYTHKINDNIYLMHITSLSSGYEPYFINNKLEKTLINYYVHRVYNDLIIISNYEKRYNIGVLGINNKIVIPIQFDNYVREYNEQYIELIEYPIFNRKISEDYLEISNYDYNNYVHADHLIYRFSKETLLLIEKEHVKGTKATSCFEYIFLSEENYLYKNLYQQISTHKFDIYKFQNLSRPHFFTLKEFDTLKKCHNSQQSIQSNLKKIEKDREVKQRLREIELKKNEGCYIATMVYKSYENPNVIILRKFRDRELKKYLLGKSFIYFYYKYSPRYVNFVKDKFLLSILSELIIKIIVRIIKITKK